MNAHSCRIGLLCLALVPTLGAGDEPAKPPEVAVARPVSREVTDYEDFTGRFEASMRVEIRPRVSGFLTASPFKEGEMVKKGDILFELDPRPYQAKLDQANGLVELHKASLQLARTTLARHRAASRVTPGSISVEKLEQDQAAHDEAVARVKAAEASAELCKLDLSFCKLSAPIRGRIGRRQVDIGNVVREGETILAVLVSQDPMYASFDIDERAYLRLRRAMKEGTTEKEKLPVSVGLADEVGFPHRGELDFVLAQLNAHTGTLSMRAVVANKDELLMPGMFARVRLPLSAPYKALLMDDRAIGSDQGSKFLYVLDAENKVQQRPITVGALKEDGLRVIDDGLKAEERVVIGLRTRLRPGMTVRPREAEIPAPKAPKPPKPPSSSRGAATGTGIVVEATYPGANAEIVSDSVRFPIEQLVTSLEKGK